MRSYAAHSAKLRLSFQRRAFLQAVRFLFQFQNSQNFFNAKTPQPQRDFNNDFQNLRAFALRKFLLIDARSQKAAVNYENFAGYKTRRFRSQKNSRAGELFDLSET